MGAHVGASRPSSFYLLSVWLHRRILAPVLSRWLYHLRNAADAGGKDVKPVESIYTRLTSTSRFGQLLFSPPLRWLSAMPSAFWSVLGTGATFKAGIRVIIFARCRKRQKKRRLLLQKEHAAAANSLTLASILETSFDS